MTDAAGWRKSSRSAWQNGCVELNGSISGYMGVRDSKLGADSPVLVFNLAEMQAFLGRVKNG
nr:DUF397 domain-containing protein [Kibdelosporangium phytohabitans]